jgi:hypothetical protein
MQVKLAQYFVVGTGSLNYLRLASITAPRLKSLLALTKLNTSGLYLLSLLLYYSSITFYLCLLILIFVI